LSSLPAVYLPSRFFPNICQFLTREAFYFAV
jgi:hypothetical protein